MQLAGQLAGKLLSGDPLALYTKPWVQVKINKTVAIDSPLSTTTPKIIGGRSECKIGARIASSILFYFYICTGLLPYLKCGYKQ